ncbi:hypothetical protein HY008_01570, partial [Candidatus Woesebacteria bacterium]|nr:hypothetical protein [Candidatus Woesebacteria bacterium]
MQTWKYTFGFLVLLALVVWLAVFSLSDQNLHIIACDVGQGDAILATYGNIQVLTDGGPNNRVLECLSGHVPFWDREIELIVLTHPQKDHYGGLIDVFKHYKVDNFLANPLEAGTTDYQVLEREVGGQGTRVAIPTGGTVVRFGLMHLDIFWPTHQFFEENGAGQAVGKLGTFTSKRDPNDFSVQAILSLGEFD